MVVVGFGGGGGGGGLWLWLWLWWRWVGCWVGRSEPGGRPSGGGAGWVGLRRGGVVVGRQGAVGWGWPVNSQLGWRRGGGGAPRRGGVGGPLAVCALPHRWGLFGAAAPAKKAPNPSPPPHLESGDLRRRRERGQRGARLGDGGVCGCFFWGGVRRVWEVSRGMLGELRWGGGTACGGKATKRLPGAAGADRPLAQPTACKIKRRGRARRGRGARARAHPSLLPPPPRRWPPPLPFAAPPGPLCTPQTRGGRPPWMVGWLVGWLGGGEAGRGERFGAIFRRALPESPKPFGRFDCVKDGVRPLRGQTFLGQCLGFQRRGSSPLAPSPTCCC